MVMEKNWLLEDEDDIFTGTPKSKYFDVTRQASKEVVEDEFDKLLEKVAVMEKLLTEVKGEDFDINNEVRTQVLTNSEEIERMKKGLYLELTGDIICRLDS
ncbi:hypothetical protein CRV03_06650 [Arcobacter sp. F155]|uniref:DUF2018 domain-containing protein n=2 Tax=Campylobacterales TaxID=213849 RepID=A0A4Q1AWH0_9BACT|nr:hypothetical protein CRV03_06650 [Arcobacter sp. F155]RXJ99032.1 hypothetical protein CRV02_12620 [Arcobacter sp. CECT 8989]RXK13168.1 hypothetical protein CP965_05045 [Halarcobacter mediterraneus]